MLHDLNAFWPVRPGTDRTYYRALYHNLIHGRLSGILTWEIAVACGTPGFDLHNWQAIMAWGDPREDNPLLLHIMDLYKDDRRVRDARVANTESVTRDDGVDWLRTMLRRSPWYRGPVPVATRRALRELREELGGKTADLNHALGFDPRALNKLRTWLSDAR
jgi:hypothetical protein